MEGERWRCGGVEGKDREEKEGEREREQLHTVQSRSTCLL